MSFKQFAFIYGHQVSNKKTEKIGKIEVVSKGDLSLLLFPPSLKKMSETILARKIAFFCQDLLDLKMGLA